MADGPVVFSRRLWLECMEQLRLRGHGMHESGCFVLGTVVGGVRRAARCVYYDELSASAYDSGVCILRGESFPKLWELCRSLGLQVLADIHTHPGQAFQSEADRQNPMIARAGHLSLIVPRYAYGWIWRHRLGLYRYEGDHRWKDLSGWQVRRHLKIRWSLL